MMMRVASMPKANWMCFSEFPKIAAGKCDVFREEASRELPGRVLKKLLEAASGFEPLHRGFADLSLNHLGTPPSSA